MSDNIDDGFSVKTEWSGDAGTLLRVDSLLRQCIQARNIGDYTMLYTGLQNLYLEALPHFDKKQKVKDNITKIKTAADDEYNNYLHCLNKYNGMRPSDRARYGLNYSGDIYNKLFSYEAELRMILQEAGMLIRTIERPKYAIG